MAAVHVGQTSSIGVPSLAQYSSPLLAGTARSQFGQIRYVPGCEPLTGLGTAFATAASFVLRAVCNTPG